MTLLAPPSSDLGSKPPAPGKLLALDVGLARIGVAVCDPLGLVARPLITLRRESRRDDFGRIAQIVQREDATAVVCGLPLNMDGSEGSQAKTTRKWAMRLAHALRAILGRPIPLIFWDERLSTFAAQEILVALNSKITEDAAAAAVILQSYLDAQRAGRQSNLGQIELPPAATR
jgi:putative Holliday junction resolvase